MSIYENDEFLASTPLILSAFEIQELIQQMAANIQQWARENLVDKLVILSILEGARPFTKDLIQALATYDIQIHLHPIKVQSTKGTQKTGNCELIYGELSPQLFEKQVVLVIDDLFDSGTTIHWTRETIKQFSPKALKTAVLLQKYAQVDHPADFTGYNLALHSEMLKQQGLADYWLFGYGMDYNGQYRDIPEVRWIAVK